MPTTKTMLGVGACAIAVVALCRRALRTPTPRDGRPQLTRQNAYRTLPGLRDDPPPPYSPKDLVGGAPPRAEGDGATEGVTSAAPPSFIQYPGSHRDGDGGPPAFLQKLPQAPIAAPPRAPSPDESEHFGNTGPAAMAAAERATEEAAAARPRRMWLDGARRPAAADEAAAADGPAQIDDDDDDFDDSFTSSFDEHKIARRKLRARLEAERSSAAQLRALTAEAAPLGDSASSKSSAKSAAAAPPSADALERTLGSGGGDALSLTTSTDSDEVALLDGLLATMRNGGVY